MAGFHDRIVEFTGVSVLVVLAACSSVDAPDAPPDVPQPPDAASLGIIVSEALTAPGAAAAGAVASVARGGAADNVAYVSLPPGTFTDGETVTITNLASGAARTEPMVDGGFDPVPIAAAVGDTLQIAIVGASGTLARAVSAVPARKPPVVVRTDPPKKKIAVPLNAVLLVVFSEPIDPLTITAETIKLLLDGQPVDGTLTLSADGLLAVLDPTELLAPLASYTLLITTSVVDLAGDALQQPVEVTFQTVQTTGAQGVIAFGRGGYIYRLDLETSELTQLAAGGAPAWSPDASKIAFTRGNDSLYVMNADGTGAVKLSRGESWTRPAWSPDGSKIAYTGKTPRPDGDGAFDWNVYVINADGSAETQLTSTRVLDCCPTWSPDGSKIAFASDRDGGGIYVMDADGSNVARLPGPGGGHPAWSPNGSKIAFYARRDGNTEIYVMNADGTGEVNLTQDPARDKYPAWSPDGTKIVFCSWRAEPFRADPPLDIYVMNADGSNVVRITASDEWWDGLPHWRP